MDIPFLSLSYQQAQSINRFVDVVHSFFPFFALVAISILIEGLVRKQKKHYDSLIDYCLTITKLIFLTLLNLIALSQGLLGGCFIYYPQTWFNRKYLGIDEPYEFGLFGRQYIPENYYFILQSGYFVGAVVVLLTSYIFVKKRVPSLRFVRLELQ